MDGDFIHDYNVIIIILVSKHKADLFRYIGGDILFPPQQHKQWETYNLIVSSWLWVDAWDTPLSTKQKPDAPE